MRQISPKMIRAARVLVRKANTTPEKKIENTTTLTKQVLRLLFEDEKISVRWGRGTVSHWVQVVILLPTNQKPSAWKDRVALMNSTKSASRTLLEKSGIRYAQYFSDWGPGNRYCNCLSIEAWFAN